MFGVCSLWLILADIKKITKISSILAVIATNYDFGWAIFPIDASGRGLVSNFATPNPIFPIQPNPFSF